MNKTTPDSQVNLRKVLQTLYHSYNGPTGEHLPVEEAMQAIAEHDRQLLEGLLAAGPEDISLVTIQPGPDMAYKRAFNDGIDDANALWRAAIQSKLSEIDPS